MSERFPVTNVVMQGSVWGGTKCTAQMDTMKKIMKSKDSLLYKYSGDTTINIGVLGMVDDTVGVSKRGVQSVEKNSLINSFIESHKFQRHEDKSVVVHVGYVRKCEKPCPALKTHKNNMHETKSTKYLGNILSQNGGVKETIKDRGNKG